MRRSHGLLVYGVDSPGPCATERRQRPNAPMVMTGTDRRPALSLNGEWASIVDPYFSGLFSFHHQEKANGFFLNRKAQPDDPFPTEYDFSKAPKLKVPGDWNTQRESLLFYEGPIWYERDFDLPAKGAYAHLPSCRRGKLSLLVLGQWQKGLRARGRLHRVPMRGHSGNQGRPQLYGYRSR